jgi:hypothetical protein
MYYDCMYGVVFRIATFFEGFQPELVRCSSPVCYLCPVLCYLDVTAQIQMQRILGSGSSHVNCSVFCCGTYLLAAAPKGQRVAESEYPT